MILHSYVEYVITMCRIQEWQLSLSYFLSYFPLMVSDAISCLLHNLKTVWNITMTLHSYVERVMAICRIQEWQLLFSYFLSYFPLMVSDAISCPLHNLKTIWNIIMILHRYVEQVMTMCHVQEWQLSFLYFLSYLPLIVKATMPSILNTVRNIFMRLYSFVDEAVTRCPVYKIWRLLCSYSPPPPPPQKKKKKKKFLDLDSLSKFTY